ncbi:MAG: class I SAM-dependent methyltransferase [Saprospiraceae bacterium]|nr:class I SAM-dependent methyltransferase [Saprospiraceae bacterium]
MTEEQAIALIEAGIDRDQKIWADLGAGSGIFTLALDRLLGFGATIFAIDQQLTILRENLKKKYTKSQIHLYEEDFSGSMPFLPKLDGILLANSLHYVRDQKAFLSRLISDQLKPGGRLIIIEYDRYDPNSYVPYPLPLVNLERICVKLDIALPEAIGRRKSIYGDHDIYSALCRT